MRDWASFLIGAILGVSMSGLLVALVTALVYYLENVRTRGPEP